ncbi:hypothetical protein FGO68_gene17575 [Halteria grandinella]|uniref:KOW domain-containing protein n=1 Tax=Halteria grandinella TaxID=5974 RepID=A0A8J8P2N6_HALGN|nr:hypothetical protein FGO68_gene17575 [Halteria grandinella]
MELTQRDSGNDKTLNRTSFADGEQKAKQRASTTEEEQHDQPSIMDSKIWKVRCIRGMERQLVVQLLLKAIDYFNNEKPFMILTIFASDKSSGFLYIEAYNKNHVLSFINGISGVNHRSVEMIPQTEVPQVLQSCTETSQTALQVHQWVRIKSGIYAGDLGLVEHIEGGPGGTAGGKRTLVRLIPRMQEAVNEKTGKTQLELVTKKVPGKQYSQVIRPAQRYFNPVLVKEDCQKEKHPGLKKSFYRWEKHLFRNGMLYLPMRVNRLQTSKVNPSLEEVTKFQLSKSTTTNNSGIYEYMSDEDEWDALDEATLKKISRDDDGAKKFDVGERVEILEGQCKGGKGVVTKKGDALSDQSQIVTVQILGKVPIEIEFQPKYLQKYFEVGEAVTVTSGMHAGGSGTITSLNEKFAGVSMDGTQAELRIVLGNLKTKKDEMEHVKFNDFIAKSLAQGSYQAGDLITYSLASAESLGVVLQVMPDFMRVLNTENKIDNVKISGVIKRLNGPTARRQPPLLDSENNSLQVRSLVNVLTYTGRGTMRGEVRAFHKQWVFLQIKQELSLPLKYAQYLKTTNGFMCCKAKEVLVTGAEFLKKVQAADQKGYIVAKVDRKVRDKKFSRFVVINAGEYKGLKAKVLFADDNIVKLEVLTNEEKVVLPRSQVEPILNPTESIPFTNQHVAAMSFDAAAQLDMGAAQDFGLQALNPAGREPYKPGQRTSSFGGGDMRMTRAEDNDEFDSVYKNGGDAF